MNKFLKTSMVTAIALAAFTSTGFGADNLKDAFTNGKVKGQLKSYYFAKSFEGSSVSDPSIWVNGGNLNFVTDYLYNLRVGATFQASHVSHIDDENNKYKINMNASGAMLSESYIEYNNKTIKTSIKAGRQYIWSPLVAASSTRFNKQSFEGYKVTNASIPGTRIMVAYLDKMQSRTDGTGNDDKIGGMPEFTKDNIGTDGAYTVYLQNKSIKGLRVRAAYLDVKDDFKTHYADLLYNYNNSLKPFIGLSYFGTDYDAASEESSYSVGIRAGVTLAKINFFAAGSKTGDDNEITRGFGFATAGHFPTVLLSPASAAYKASAESFQVGASYNFGKLYTRLTHSRFDLDTSGFGIFNNDLEETTLNLKYKFDGQLKGLTASIDYALVNSAAANQEENTLWTKLIYSF